MFHTSSLLRPNNFLTTLFSDILNLCSSLEVRDKVSHRNKKNTGKIIVLYILTFSLKNVQDDTRFWTEWWQAFPEVIFSKLLECKFDLLLSFRNIWTFQHFSKAVGRIPVLTLWFCPVFCWRGMNIVSHLCRFYERIPAVNQILNVYVYLMNLFLHRHPYWFLIHSMLVFYKQTSTSIRPIDLG
jgi:hypothetical protein